MDADFDVNSECTTWEHDVCPELDSFAISRSTDDTNRTVVSFSYRLVASELPNLLSDLRMELADDEPELVIDMSVVKEIDTAGLVILLQCIAEVIRRDGRFAVGGISPEAATFVELTGLDRLIAIPRSVEADPEFEFVSQVALESSDTDTAFAA